MPKSRTLRVVKTVTEARCLYFVDTAVYPSFSRPSQVWNIATSCPKGTRHGTTADAHSPMPQSSASEAADLCTKYETIGCKEGRR